MSPLDEAFKSHECPNYSLKTLNAATNNFAKYNELAEGGFGNVFKGMLPTGQEIAAKRLSRNFSVAATQFQNEIDLVSRLQHKNVVRLLGCCTEGGEIILVYEYMPNGSLNDFLFNPIKCEQLDWSTRLEIVLGLTRGLIYLHEDSRLKIIHRDLKASNILLDKDMNPKISDFGLAKLLGEDGQTQYSSSRVAGTFGYMAPEYLLKGQVSEKLDIYSFGVLILEIISGEQNLKFVQKTGGLDLLGCSWKLWKEGRPLELVDHSLFGHYIKVEVLRCIHVGLLCVQESALERPNVSCILDMLTVDNANLPDPIRPSLLTKSDL